MITILVLGFGIAFVTIGTGVAFQAIGFNSTGETLERWGARVMFAVFVLVVLVAAL